MSTEEIQDLAQDPEGVFWQVRTRLNRGDEPGVISFLKTISIGFYDQAIVANLLISARTISLLRWFLEWTKEMLNCPHVAERESSPTRLNHLLWWAISQANLEAVKLLVEYGADIHSPSSVGSQSPLSDDAVRTNYTALVRWMLEHGADPNANTGGITRSHLFFPAIQQRNLPMVKVLVEHRARINGTDKRSSALPRPVVPDRKTRQWVQDEGLQKFHDYLRSQGGMYPWEMCGEPEPPLPEISPSPEEDSLSYHFNDCLGGASRNPFATEILRPDWPIIVHLLRVDYEFQHYWILATEGMSAVPMNVPPDNALATEYQYAELFIQLPLDWPVNEAWMNRPQNRWMLDWLFRIARWPHENNTWLGPAAVFANDEPPQPLAPGMPFTCLLVTPTDDDFSRWKVSDDKLVRYYWVNPIYTEERDFERQHDTRALFERITPPELSPGFSYPLDLRRPNSVQGK